MSNSELISFFQDIYNPFEMMLFCEMKSYHHLLLVEVENSTDDNWYDYQWFKDKSEEFKNLISNI